MKLNRMKYEGGNIQILLIFLRPLLVHSSPRLLQPICKWNWVKLGLWLDLLFTLHYDSFIF